MLRSRSASVFLGALLLCAAASLSPRTAGANATPVFFDGGAGGAVFPRSTDAVRMVSEHLEFVESTSAAALRVREPAWWLPWHVRADYVLENLTDQDVDLDVGFPIAGHRGWNDVRTTMDETFRPGPWLGGRETEPFTASFHVRLDEKETPHRMARHSCPAPEGGDASGATGFCHSHVFVFRVAIAARAKASLTVEYDQDPALCCSVYEPHAWVDYILETGALWAGTIGTLDIVYRFAVPPGVGADQLSGPVGQLECMGRHVSAGVLIEDQLAGASSWNDAFEQDLYLDSREPAGPPSRWRVGYSPCAPMGFVDLWDPPVRFDYAFGCEDERLVLRLGAADVEPGGNISLGVQDADDRLRAQGELAHCAVARARKRGASASWSPWKWTAADAWLEPEEGEGPAGPPPEWGCSLANAEHGHEYEYRFDCCCAAAANLVPWYPQPNDADAGDAADQADVSDAADVSLPPSPEAHFAQGATADADAAAVLPPAATDAAEGASRTPAGGRSKSGCQCGLAGAGGAGLPSSFAVLGMLFLAGRRGGRRG